MNPSIENPQSLLLQLTALSTLRTDALSGLRTSFFGQGMETAYQQSRAESGSGSTARKQAFINGALMNEGLFRNLMRDFKVQFVAETDMLQTQVQTVIASHLDIVKETLNLIRDENVALESERDVEFRERVRDVLADVGEEYERGVTPVVAVV